MKKVKKYVSVILAGCCLCAAFGMSASAATEVCPHGYGTFGDHVMNGGVGQYGNFRRYYYINPGFNGYYTGWIRSGVDEWVHTTSGVGVTTSISIYETTTKSDAMFEFLNSSKYGSRVFGMTELYLYQERIPDEEIGTRNWGWAKMVINTQYMDNCNLLANYQKKAICMHEMGHAMGLSHHNTSVYDLMYPRGNVCRATRATAKECELINHLYG